MNRSWIMTLVFAVVLVFAQPAGAEKPNCDEDSSHPSCKSDEPAIGPGYTCSWLERGGNWAEDPLTNYEDDFTIILNRENQEACIDVVTSTPGVWYVTVTGSGAKWMAIVPRDAVGPGDSCGGRQRKNANIYEMWELPAPFDTRFREIPAATVNACPGNAHPDGVGEFAEWLDFNDNGVVDEDEAVMEPTSEVHPLALQVHTSGLQKRGAEVTVCVDLPNETYGFCG